MLYITHDIASARYFADEVLVMYAGQIVERGPAEQLTQRPAHPYTQLLVASAPDPDNLGSVLRGGRRAGDGRNPAVPRDQPAHPRSQAPEVPAGRTVTGCPFNRRCPFADDKCRREDPALVRISATRGAACWHLEEAAPGLLGLGPRGGGETTAE
jgi:peptide/nickel transport system ATP-binding protein